MAVKRYDGSQWVTVAGKGDQGTSSSISTWVKTATGGETSVSGNDDNSQPLSYTVGQELVFINGALQKRGADYTATTGNSITGLTALAANDVVTVWTVNAFSVTGAIANSIVDAKGDLIVATGADTPGRLAVGSNNQVLTADSTTGTGLKWATPASGYTLISRQTFTSTGTQTFDNIFSDTYDNYQIVLLYGNTTANETADLNMQFRYGATPTTQTQYYNYGYTKQNPNGGTLTNVGNLDASGIRLSDDTGTQFILHMFISRYSDRLWGGYFATTYSLNGGADPWGIRGNFQNRFARSGSDAYHGLYFFNTAGSATGNISIYGQAKS